MEQTKILFNLIKNNKYEEFKKVITNDKLIDINFKDENGNYLIAYAIIKNNIDIVETMIKKEFRVDITDQEGRSLLYLPIKYGYNEIIDLLIKYDKHNTGIPIVDFKDKFTNIPLHYAIFFKNSSAIETLLHANSNPNTTDENGNNSLHLAIYSQNFLICKKIIEKDVNINSKTSIGETALHIACNFQLFDIIKLLIENGIDIDAQDYNNEITALVYSVNLNDNHTSKYLLHYGANPNIQDFMGNTVAHYSIIEENYEILNELVNPEKIKIKPNFNIYNINSELPIHLLLTKTTSLTDGILEKLIDKSNLNFQNSSGNTPLHLICKKNIWNEYSDILIKKKMNIFIKNHKGEMPIDYIAKTEINKFIDLITKSYLYILRNYSFVWNEDWENMCNKELFYNSLTDDEIKILSKYYHNIDKEIDKEICYKIINNKITTNYKHKITNKITNKITEDSKGQNNNMNCDNSSYPQKKNRKCVNLNMNSKIEFCSFTGITLDILIGLIYLLNKYSFACSTLTSNFITNTDLCNYFSSIGFKPNTHCEFLNFEIVWVYKKLFFSDNFANNFNKCINNMKIRFVVVPLGIELEEGSHANYLIFDKKTYEIERFEPYGYGTPYKFNYDSKLLDNILTFKFSEINENIKYINPAKFLPKIGFQYLDVYESKTKNIGDPGGFCALWSIWYTEMRLKYPDIERKTLVNKLFKEIKLMNVSFKNLIRNYSINITNLRDELFKQSNITINDWLNEQYTQEQYSQIIENIKKLLSPQIKNI